MRFVLTKHAEHVLRRRAIPLELVESVLDKPDVVEQDRTDPKLEHRLCRMTAYDNRVLRVVVDVRVNPMKVITAFWDRRMRNKR